MTEYGGYIEFEYFHGKQYHENALALNSGTHCAEYLIRARNIRKLVIPYFMCGCIKNVCDKLGVLTSYYHTDIHFMPLCDSYFSDPDTALYIVNFYGQLSNATIAALKEKYGNIIVDNVQAFFQMPIDGLDTIYTCRKFFGVADGAYLYTNAVMEGELETDTSYDRMEFLFGRQEKGANAFYARYVANNDRFEEDDVKKMSIVTQNLLRAFDYEKIARVRTENYSYLHRCLGEDNKLELTVPYGAYMYPLYLERGVEIRKALQKERIYIPTLWPDVFEVCSETELEYDMALNILPLPVDQRYTVEDMAYIVDRILDISNTKSHII